MTPTPWAQAVEAGADAALREVMGRSCHDRECQCNAGLTCDHCLPRVVRAVLPAAAPHLLRGIVGELSPWAIDSLHVASQAYLGGANVYPGGYEAVRAKILSALTAAAGRVDAVTHDPHIGDHA